jgi:predicted ATPase/DNA-binding winged helix-turn-helix (wHTH) protein
MTMGQEVRFGRHRFDPRTGQLWSGRREIKLTPRAAAVLAALIDRAGQPVTRDELFRSVWRDVIVGDAALTACIQELRTALDDDARRPRFIETRHRQGYRFVARTVQPPPGGPTGDSSRPTRHGLQPPALVVGRDKELKALHACLARVGDGERQIVFVTGEPGIGKTTAIAAFLAELAGGERRRVARGRCIETHGAGEAYLPLIEAMTDLCGGADGPSIIRLLRHHAPTWLVEMPSLLRADELTTLRRQASGVTRERMLRELAEAVEVIAADVPLVLWLEDLHWSDSSTVDWLAYLARRPSPARILVLGSYRPGAEMTRGPSLEAVKDELKMHGRCREVALARLDEAAVDAYLVRRFPGAGTLGDLAGAIHRRTGGNPLFVVNVAEDLARRGVLIERNGCWALAAPPDIVDGAVPDDVRRMIEHALDRVGPHERRLLEAGSVAGAEFSAAAVAAAERTSLDEAERGCAELARRASFLTLLGSEAWPDGTIAARFGFRHALYQDVVYESIPMGRRAELHRRIGARLEAGAGERAVELASKLAMHFERGRDAARAIRYLRLAGEIATQRSATSEAVGHLTRALDLLGAAPDTQERAEQEVALQIALGGPLMAVKGRGAPEVERAYTRAEELCERIGDPARRFPVLWGLFLFHRSRGEIDVAHRFGERLLAQARRADDAGLLIEAHHALWATLFARGELTAVLEHAARALSLYDPARHAALAATYGNHDPAVCALGHGAWALELRGEAEEAGRQSEDAVARARALGHPFSEAHALLYGARLHQLRDDWRGTHERAAAAAELARAQGFVQLQAWAAVTDGWALAEGGELERGLATMRDGIAAIRTLGSQEFKTYFLGLLAGTLAAAGQLDAAVDVVAEALVAVERSGERFYAAELHRLRGELLLAGGRDRGGAVRCFETALDVARRQGALALEARAARSLGRVRHLTPG